MENTVSTDKRIFSLPKYKEKKLKSDQLEGIDKHDSYWSQCSFHVISWRGWRATPSHMTERGCIWCQWQVTSFYFWAIFFGLSASLLSFSCTKNLKKTVIIRWEGHEMCIEMWLHFLLLLKQEETKCFPRTICKLYSRRSYFFFSFFKVKHCVNIWQVKV